MTGRGLLPILLAAALGAAGTVRADEYQERRLRLIREVESMGRSVAPRTGRGPIDARVLEALARLPRHLFVPWSHRPYAYRNRPLPIGYGQTISQPYIVALMTDLLKLVPGQVALEVGTGSAYQAAMLAEMGVRVYTMEIVEPLAESARVRLAELGYRDVTVRWGDGYEGWKEHAPYDAIIVTAAASHIPPPLIAQLKPGGRMVIPVGGWFLTQQLVLLEKDAGGQVRTRQVLPVAFVPLRRKR